MSDISDTETGGSTPVTVQIEITDRCNMRCPMCITSEHRNKLRNEVISPEFIQSKILTPLRNRGIRWLTLSGGEPTLSPHLLQIIHDARSLGYGIFLATNALTEQLYSFDTILRALELVPSAVQVSFDSIHKEEMSRIRGGDYFVDVRDNFTKLSKLVRENKYLTKLVASIVVQEQNADSFLETIDYALSILRVNTVIVQLRHDYRHVTPLNWKKQNPLMLTPSSSESILKNGKILFERAKTDRQIIVVGGSIKNWKALLTKPTDIDITCKAARRIFIDPYGNLRGCIHSEIIGDLKDMTIDTYLDSEAYQNFLSFSRNCNICIHGCSR